MTSLSRVGLVTGHVIGGQAGATNSVASSSEAETATRPFTQVLKDAIAQVNDLQIQAQQAAEAVARGDVTDLHRVSLAIERARLALELTVAVRNKLIEAYQEISRMPI